MFEVLFYSFAIPVSCGLGIIVVLGLLFLLMICITKLAERVS